MQIHVNFGSVPASATLEEHVIERVQHHIGRMADRLTRVEAHLHDDNSLKHGPADKRCLLEARPRGMDPITAEDRSDDIYTAVSGAARKLQSVLTSRFEKLEAT